MNNENEETMLASGHEARLFKRWCAVGNSCVLALCSVLMFEILYQTMADALIPLPILIPLVMTPAILGLWAPQRARVHKARMLHLWNVLGDLEGKELSPEGKWVAKNTSSSK